MEQRRFMRYDVADHPKLRGYINEESDSADKLVTIGLGGCGFYGETSHQFRLAEGKPITCTFEMDGILSRPVKIPGNIAYAYTKNEDRGSVVFCGIEFEEAYHEKVWPIIHEIEKERSASN